MVSYEKNDCFGQKGKKNTSHLNLSLYVHETATTKITSRDVNSHTTMILREKSVTLAYFVSYTT